MSRSVKGSKGSGYDYWGKRALSCCSPGRTNKKLTLGIERMLERQLVNDELGMIANFTNDFNHEVNVLKDI